MAWKKGKTAAVALSLAALATIIPVASASAATASPARTAINTVPCNDSSFLQVWWHYSDGPTEESCFANAGVSGVYYINGEEDHVWLTSFSTGNNEVQWYGDGRWQPATPVGKWTYFTFPNHPGGVDMTEIKIW
jgi:hypothetical protein